MYENDQEVADSIIRVLRNDNNREVRAAAATGLTRRSGESIDRALIEATSDPDAVVRSCAIGALDGRKNKALAAALIQILKKNDDPYVRGIAAIALGRFEPNRAISEALTNAKDNDGDTHVKKSANYALIGRIPGYVEPLRKNR